MLLWREYLMQWKLYLRDGAATFWTMAFPVLMLLAFGTIFKDGGAPPVKVVRVVAGAEVPGGKALADHLAQSKVKVEDVGAEEGERRWKEGKTALLLEGTEAAPRMRVNAYLTAQGMTGMNLVQQAFLAAQAEARGEPARRIPFEVVSPGKAKAANYAAFLLPGLVGLNLLSMGLFSVGMVNVAYKEKGKFRRLAVTPLPKWIFLAGQVLHRLTMTLVQSAILLAVGWFVFGIRNQGSYLELAAALAIGTACFISLGFALSTFAESSETYTALSNLLFFPMMFLGGVYFTLDSAPRWMQQAVQALPLSPLLQALRSIFNDGATLAGHGLGLAIVGIWALLAFGLAVKRFRFA